MSPGDNIPLLLVEDDSSLAGSLADEFEEYRHTIDAKNLSVAIDADGIAIRNSSDATNTQVNEEGLGLEIVQRVCDRMGWGFSARPQGKEFVARVTLKSRSKEGR